MPINRNNFQKHLESVLGYDYSIDILNSYLSWVERFSVVSSNSADQIGFLDILHQYFDLGLITADEAARQMQERAEIFFSE